MVGMWLGIHEARRVDGLVLANTAARIGTREGWDERIATVRRSGLAQLANATLERWFTAPFRQGSLQEMDTIRTMIASTPPEGYVGCCAALRDGDLRPQVGTIRARTLVIAGGHDPATTPEDGRRLHEAVPNSSYVELETAHLSAWERPEEFQRAVLDFLR
jgi:3-oxoadipate enol-lactonase